MRSRVHAFTCAACGGTLACDDHEPTVTCQWCDVDNHLIGEDLPRSFYAEPVVERKEAVRIVRRQTAASRIAPGFSRDLRIERGDLVFLPFNAVRALRTGRMVVEKVESRPASTGAASSHLMSNAGWGGVVDSLVPDIPSTTRTGPVERDTRVVFSEMLLHEPACPTRDLGDRHVSFERNVFGKDGVPLLSFNRSKMTDLGSILDPETHPRDLRARLDEAGHDAQSDRRIETVGAQLYQVYYPLWIVRGTYRGRSHRFVLDALDGTLLAGRVPASRGHQAVVGAASVFVGAAPLAAVLHAGIWWLLAAGVNPGLVGWLAGVVAILLTAGWASIVMGWLTATFRRSRELVFRGGALEEETLDVPPESAVERLGYALVRMAEKSAVTGGKVVRDV